MWKKRGVRFHRIRDFKQYYFISIPPTFQRGHTCVVSSSPFTTRSCIRKCTMTRTTTPISTVLNQPLTYASPSLHSLRGDLPTISPNYNFKRKLEFFQTYLDRGVFNGKNQVYFETVVGEIVVKSPHELCTPSGWRARGRRATPARPAALALGSPEASSPLLLCGFDYNFTNDNFRKPLALKQ